MSKLNIIGEVIKVIAVIAVFALVGYLSFINVEQYDKSLQELGCEGGTIGQCKCEKAGGIFFDGGVFSADNCVILQK